MSQGKTGWLETKGKGTKAMQVKLIKNVDSDARMTTGKKIDKRSRLPAYAQLANILRSGISHGEYPPGDRLPSESALAKFHGVSAMTARQAVSVLEEEGLVRRIQGKGTYVRKMGVTTSSFEMVALKSILSDRKNLAVRIIQASVKKTPGMEKEMLQVKPDQPVIMVERVILYKNDPLILHESYTEFDPTSPSVESMLDTVVLTEVLFKEGYSNFKKGVLNLMPACIGEREAKLLGLKAGESVFKFEHLFYSFEDKPAAFGAFMVSHEKMPLVSRIGIWDE